MAKQQPTEQQQEIINAIAANVAVSAGAGSGKTQVLIGRFMHILENSFRQGLAAHGKYPVNVDQIVAITFTKKAAAEMRSRLRHELNGKLLELEQAVAEGQLDTFQKGYYAEFWRSQLERLPRTHICTIHSLCSYILRENPLETNLDPQFTVAEEYEGTAFIQDCLERYVRIALRNQNEHIMTLAECYGLGGFLKQMQLLLPLLKDIKAAGDLLKPYHDNLASIPLEKEKLCECLRDLAENGDLYQKPSTKAYRDALAKVAVEFAEITEAIWQEPADLAPLEDTFAGVQARNDFKDIMQEIRALAISIKQKEMDKLAMPIVEHWQFLLEELYNYVLQEKQAVDLLTFDDLEDCAISLLKNYEEVRHKYHLQFAHIMVDEFQDTNDKQRELIYLLCGDSSDHLQGNKLFVVGDSKQSIYRFRGADVSVFKRVQKEIAQLKGRCLSMNKNFRSRESILKAVNAIFNPLLGVSEAQDVFFSALEPDVPRLAGGEKVKLYTAFYDGETKNNKHALEAEIVVGKILELQQKGVALKDITILLRSMTRLDVLLPALQKYNVPFVLHSGRGFYEEQEILDIINILKVLQNKYRNIELAGCLRSPYFGIDDESLTKLFLKTEECLWDTFFTVEISLFKSEQQPFVLRARKILLQLRQMASCCGLGELWLNLLQLLQVGAVLSQQQLGDAKLANIQKLGNIIFTFVQEQQGTLASWLTYVEQLRDYGAKETIATVEAESAVQVMTYHASKGLQFPVVLLPFLEGEEPNDTDSVVFVPPNKLHPENSWGLGVKVINGYELQDTYLLKQVRLENRRLDFEERKRLLYVAATRAEQQLFLFGCAELGKDYTTEDWQQKNWYVQLVNLLGESSEVISVDGKELRVFLRPMAKTRQQQIDTSAALLRPLANYDELGNNFFSPSALQSYAHCPRCYFYHYGLKLPGYSKEDSMAHPSENQLDAATLGKVVHSTLEYYSRDVYDSKELAQAYAIALQENLQGSRENTERAKIMLEQYLHSSLLPPLSKADKELEFTFCVEGLTITGFIDCMYENADGTWTIVDYKTGRVPTLEAGKNAGYMYQLALYRLAVETLFNRKVSRCELHYLQELKTVGLDNDDEYRYYLKEALNCCHDISKMPKTESAFLRSCGQKCTYCEYAYMCK